MKLSTFLGLIFVFSLIWEESWGQCSAGSASSSPMVCVGTPISAITHSTNGVTGLGSSTGLPQGVTANLANNIITITGAPTESGAFSYSIPLQGGDCMGESATGTITVFELPAPSITGVNTICNGESTTLSASGGISYLWSTGATTASINLSPTLTTPYTVTVTNGSGCTNSTSQSVTVNSTPTATISGTTTICNGQSTTLTASGGTSYLWSTGATTASINPSPTLTTPYTVTVTNGSGCTNSASQSVIVNSTPIATISGTTTICNGQSTTLTASGGTSYLWSTGATTVSINLSPTLTTPYTVTVTNGSGCTNSAGQSLTVNSTPTATISGTTTICNGQSTTLTASGGTSYLWSTGATTASINPSPTLTTPYTVTVTNGSGCTSSTSQSVTVNSTPTATISGTTTICNGQSTTLTASGGTSYLWSTSATTASINPSPTLTTPYTVTVTNGSGCSNSTIQSVTVNSKPLVNISGMTTICSEQSTTLTASGGTSYSWNTGATTAAITLTPGSTSIYTVTVTNIFSCTEIGTSTIQVNPLPNASISFEENSGLSSIDTIVCSKEIVTLTALPDNLEYSWSNGRTDQVIVLTPVFSNLYTVTVTDENGCKKSEDFELNVINRPTSLFEIDYANSKLVYGEKIKCKDLSINGNANINNWLWIFNKPNGAQVEINNKDATLGLDFSGNLMVTLIVADEIMCKDTSKINVNIASLTSCNVLDITYPTVPKLCEGSTLVLTANPNYLIGGDKNINWEWNLDGASIVEDFDTNFITIKFDKSGMFDISASFIQYTGTTINPQCVSDTFSLTINVNPNPIVSFKEDTISVCKGKTIDLDIVLPTAADEMFTLDLKNLSTGLTKSDIVKPNKPGNIYSSTYPQNGGIDVDTKLSISNVVNNTTQCAAKDLDTLAIKVLNLPNSNISADPVCEGDTLKIFVPSSNSFSWTKDGVPLSENNNLVQISESGINNYGTYAVIITDAQGCSASNSIIIDNKKIQTTPTPSITGDSSPCNNAYDVIYTANGSSTDSAFVWTVSGGDSLYQISDSVSVHWKKGGAPKEIKVVVTSSAGCTSNPVTIPVQTKTEEAPDVAEILWAPGLHLLICQEAGLCYQWGTSTYGSDNRITKSDTLPGETAQAYYLPKKDDDPFKIKNTWYWVDIWSSPCTQPGSCKTRCYFKRTFPKGSHFGPLPDDELNGSDSTSNKQQKLRVNMYPNPTNDLLNLDIDCTVNTSVVGQFYLPDGRMVLESSWDCKAGDNKLQIPLGQLQAGLYFLVLKESESAEMVRKPLVIQR